MADTPDTPDAPAAEKAKPATRRRAAPRKIEGKAEGKPAAAPKAPRARKAAPKSTVAQVEDTVTNAATAARDAVTGAADKAVKAVKPRSSKRSTPRPAGRTAATKRAAPAKRTGKKGANRSTLDKATDRVGGRWGAAAIVGSVAAAAGAALLTLRGSSRVPGSPKKPIDISGTGDKGEGHPQLVQAAHQADGTDSSASFEAGIADEGTIPGRD